jgi:hypothetical protein
MPGCKPPCVEIITGSTRQKWNYVKNLYNRSYTIDAGYNYEDARAVDDIARVEDEILFTEMYNTDLSAWLSYAPAKPFERFLEWRYTYGTTAYANLPQHKRNDHVGHCWAPCPYSTQSSIARTRFLLGLSDSDPLPARTDHTNTEGKLVYMKTSSIGTAWGFECQFDGCTYYIANGQHFYYV